MPAPELVLQVRDAVSGRVQQALAETGTWFDHVGPETADLTTVAADLLTGGKRLRAAFAAAGWRTAGGEPLAPAETGTGAGLELFQMAALVHDDLMDDSATRRGMPAAHRRFHRMHTERSMTGDPERYGSAGAILLGDLLLVASMHELEAALDLVPPAPRRRGRAVVGAMMAEVTVGQYLDMYAQVAPWSADPDDDVDRAWRVIRSKSARYSVEHPLVLGATLAGADEIAVERLRAVGLPIGEAFQLRDDVLGVFGDPQVTGKPAGDDLREGKRTVLLALAMARGDAAQRDVLASAVGRSDLDADGVEVVRDVLAATGAVDAVEQLIGERYDAALHALSRAELPEVVHELIASLAHAATARTA